MDRLNIEIKARTSEPERIRTLLRKRGADFIGQDAQCDTYFTVPNGRLKLREGEIENALIHYHRENTSGPKRSDVTLYHPDPNSALKKILSQALGVDVVVEKRREIYLIDNVKFHIDELDELGSFIEIEAIDDDGALDAERLERQCRDYLELFKVEPDDLVAESYSDLIR